MNLSVAPMLNQGQKSCAQSTYLDPGGQWLSIWQLPRGGAVVLYGISKPFVLFDSYILFDGKSEPCVLFDSYFLLDGKFNHVFSLIHTLYLMHY